MYIYVKIELILFNFKNVRLKVCKSFTVKLFVSSFKSKNLIKSINTVYFIHKIC